MIDAVELTRRLVGIDSVNPPGREEECARLLAALLEDAGFRVECPSHALGRTSVVATLAGTGSGAPLALSGHLDTVPFGAEAWEHDPLSGEIAEGRLYGRGSSDMKSGVAALVAAAAAAARRGALDRGIVVIFSAAEETGCEGVRFLADGGAPLAAASALLVAEPTSNRLAVGHKGAYWLKAVARGVTAHGSMPQFGDNAVYKAAAAVSRLSGFAFAVADDPMLGRPTLNVGTFQGGANVNSVPDHAEFTIDIRTTDPAMHDTAYGEVSETVGPDLSLEVMMDLPPVRTAPDDAFVDCVRAVAGEPFVATGAPRVLPYFTDASILGPAMSAPTVILGPGEADLAHQTDEYCRVDLIGEAVELYRDVIARWCGRPGA